MAAPTLTLPASGRGNVSSPLAAPHPRCFLKNSVARPPVPRPGDRRHRCSRRRRPCPIARRQRAAVADAPLPQHGPVMSGSSASTMPDFCPAFSARLPREDRRDCGRAEVEIGTFGIRTVAAILRGTREIVGITLGHLSRPFELSARHVERDEGVGSVLGRIRIAVARRRVDRVRLEIDRRRRPDRAAGGPEQLDAH